MDVQNEHFRGALAKRKASQKSFRLAGYDYSDAGAFFITVCSYKRRPLSGTIRDGEVQLSSIGEIVREQWLRTGVLRAEVELDAFVVMPNHFHGILWIVDSEGPGICVRAHCNAPLRRSPKSLGSIISGFKGAVTRAARDEYSDRSLNFWHRNYFEHVIRNERSLERIRRYIRNNPQKWQLDQYFTESSM